MLAYFYSGQSLKLRLHRPNLENILDLENLKLYGITICIESKSIYNSRLIDLGIVRIGDLYDTRGDFKSNKEPLYSTLTPVEHFLLFSLCNAFPEEWRKILKTNKNSIYSKTHYLIQTDFILRIEGKKVNLQSLKSKSLYDSFVSKISSIPAAQMKYNAQHAHIPVRLGKDISSALQNKTGY